jgi:hypothetical protein
MSKKKNWTEEKSKLLGEIQAFLNSPELATVRTRFNELNERMSKVPARERSAFDNFTNAYVAFFNMMNWATDFSWNRNMKVFNFMFNAEHK